MSSNDDRTVVAGRRRRSEAPGPAGRERASTPQRQRDGGQGSAPPPSGGGGGGSNYRPSGQTGSGLPIPSGTPLWLIIAVVIIGFCLFSSGILNTDSGGGAFTPVEPDVTSDSMVVEQPTPRPTVRPRSTATPRPTSSAANNGAAPNSGDRWLIMLYQDADDKVLEQDIYVDLNEAERIGSNDSVQIVAQLDRFRGGFRDDGNWTSAKRLYVTQDDDLQRVSSDVVADLGEVNMADPNTLIDFATWAMQTYPADKYVLILSDHGMGWPGGWTDSDTGSNPAVRGNTPLAIALGNALYLNALDDALGEILSRTGVEKLELVGLDACLMGHVEVMSALAPHARYAVVSQEVEPSIGWAYTGFLGALQQNPGMDGAELSRIIVDSYIIKDQVIVDDQARAEFLSRSGSGGFLGAPSARQFAEEMARNVTLTAVDLSQLPALMQSIDALANEMQRIPQQGVAKARNYAQSFTSVFGENVPPSYIDVANFAQLLKRVSNDATLAQAADAVSAAVQQAVVAEKHGRDKPGATGVSIYFPNSQLYRNPATGPQSYTVVAGRFADTSLWDEFLSFHYTGRTFELTDSGRAIPAAGANTRAPGAGRITLTPITLSSSTAARNETVTLRTNVSGDNVGYIYFFTGYLDKQANSIFIVDQDYLESPQTRQVNGVYYPDWGEGSFNLEFAWEPLAFAITDGNQSVEASLTPRVYGATYQDTIYTVDGTLNFADGSPSRAARLFFRDGVLRQVFTFNGESTTGALAEARPEAGDSFTVQETWIDLDASGNAANTVTQPGKTITFSNQPLQWKELDAAAGDYIVGFIVADLDGNTQTVYASVTVR